MSTTRLLHSLPKTLLAHDRPLDQPCQWLVSSTHCLKDSPLEQPGQRLVPSTHYQKHYWHLTALLINNVNDSSLPFITKTLLAFTVPLTVCDLAHSTHGLTHYWHVFGHWPQQSTFSTTSNEIKEADAFLHSSSCVPKPFLNYRPTPCPNIIKWYRRGQPLTSGALTLLAL